MKRKAKSVPVDLTIEYLVEQDFIRDNQDGTYSWNFNPNSSKYFTYAEVLPLFRKHFGLKYRAQAHRSIQEALSEIGLSVKSTKSWNMEITERKHRSITSEFGRWFIANHGTVTMEKRVLYAKLYRRWKLGKLKIDADNQVEM